MLSKSWIGMYGAVVVVVVGLAGCAPRYPYCDTDAQCRVVAPYLVCAQGRCTYCRDNSHCNRGSECRGGTCVAIAGWCETGSACPGGQLCIDNRCRPCEVDRECGQGNRCESGRCLSGPRECLANRDCAEGQVCEMGRCR